MSTDCTGERSAPILELPLALKQKDFAINLTRIGADKKSRANTTQISPDSLPHMQILYNIQQKQKAIERIPAQKKNTTRAVKMEAKKVNNMPNLQSMSQAKG